MTVQYGGGGNLTPRSALSVSAHHQLCCALGSCPVEQLQCSSFGVPSDKLLLLSSPMMSNTYQYTRQLTQSFFVPYSVATGWTLLGAHFRPCMGQVLRTLGLRLNSALPAPAVQHCQHEPYPHTVSDSRSRRSVVRWYVPPESIR